MKTRRVVTLESLPPYGIFWTPATGWRGLILSWHRTRTGERREASVLLLRGKRDDEPGIRKTLRAGIPVEVEDRDDVVNLSTRHVTADDAFAGRYVQDRAAREKTGQVVLFPLRPVPMLTVVTPRVAPTKRLTAKVEQMTLLCMAA